MELPKTTNQKIIKYFQKKVIHWGRLNYADFPWRKTKNKWHAIVAEIMLQRTRAEQVELVFNSFRKKYKIPKDYLDDSRSDVFSTLGLPQREVLLKKLSSSISKSGIPEDKQSLLQLPGIGNYIASAYRSLHIQVLFHLESKDSFKFLR